MGLFDSISGWLRKETSDIGEALDDVTESLDRDLTRKEHELTASPEERMAIIGDQIDDDPFAAIRNRIEASTAHADAEADVDAIDGPVIDDRTNTGDPNTGDADIEDADIDDADIVAAGDGPGPNDEA